MLPEIILQLSISFFFFKYLFDFTALVVAWVGSSSVTRINPGRPAIGTQSLSH